VVSKVNNPHYLYRMTVLLSISMLAPVLGSEATCSTMLPIVLNAAKDRVPNIRFNVAKMLQSFITIVEPSVSSKDSHAIVNLAFDLRFIVFLSPHFPLGLTCLSPCLPVPQIVEQSIRPALFELNEDPDPDVRFFANQALQACDQLMVG
ncbi:unnamed protein product, partial [Closterium sp. NIES-54]